MFMRLAVVTIGIGLIAAPSWAQTPSESLLRNQTRVLNQAVGTQTRQAVQSPEATVTRAMRVTAPAANLRAEPTAKARILGVLPRGTELTATGPENGDWTSVNYQGKTGYVVTSLLAQEK